MGATTTGEVLFLLIDIKVVSAGIGYTLQLIGQKGAPATDVALVLSLEGVFAALFGWLFLDELLTGRQLLGCGLMFGGMLLAQFGVGNRECVQNAVSRPEHLPCKETR